jgi:thiamine-phosphate pyrophosphorylase
MIGPLCVITDAEAPMALIDQAEAAARGGASQVQLRHKGLDDGTFAELAREILGRLAPFPARLIINDRIAVARAVGAHGLHIGQSDGTPRAARNLIGPGMLLGLSIEAPEQMAAVPEGVVDYLGVGPIRATPSKPDHASPMGLAGLAAVTAATCLPCLAIGGLGMGDIDALQAAGAAGLAVVSAVTRAADPEAATRALVEAWRRG